MNATRTRAPLPPLTLDDLIDLHFMLEADELFMSILCASLDGARGDA